MISDLLLKFFQSGRLGLLHFGLCKSEVQNYLGEPGDIGKVGKKVVILKYEDLELSFYKNEMQLIALYFNLQYLKLPKTLFSLEEVPQNHLVKPDYIICAGYPYKGIKVCHLQKVLLESDLNYKESQVIGNENAGVDDDFAHITLKVGIGVTVSFDSDKGGLYTMQLSRDSLP